MNETYRALISERSKYEAIDIDDAAETLVLNENTTYDNSTTILSADMVSYKENHI